mmetsp:Transcript_6457/g.26651  ORF Transcript_6457/g.26651 Transcript_6457/m.26651 type:complete len:308 (+) Transcript_6457:220-1143(+)
MHTQRVPNRAMSHALLVARGPVAETWAEAAGGSKPRHTEAPVILGSAAGPGAGAPCPAASPAALPASPAALPPCEGASSTSPADSPAPGVVAPSSSSSLPGASLVAAGRPLVLLRRPATRVPALISAHRKSTMPAQHATTAMGRDEPLTDPLAAAAAVSVGPKSAATTGGTDASPMAAPMTIAVACHPASGPKDSARAMADGKMMLKPSPRQGTSTHRATSTAPPAPPPPLAASPRPSLSVTTRPDAARQLSATAHVIMNRAESPRAMNTPPTRPTAMAPQYAAVMSAAVGSERPTACTQYATSRPP